MKRLLLLLSISLAFNSYSQEFTRADTLRGSITPERAWWDVTYYDLKVSVNPLEKTIEGNNTITYKVLKPNDVMQIDLQAPMKIDSIFQDGKEIKFTSEGDAHFLKLQKKLKKGAEAKITIYTHSI